MAHELRNALKAGHELHWYRIDKVLGQGGFGITYLAHDPNLDQYVAIKEYLPMELAVRDGDNSVYPASSANGERFRWGLDRFITEARTLAKFKHPAIVRVLTVFEDNNTAYMVMEYERGESLQQVLERRKTLDEDELIPILAPLLDGLEMIHATGFIHRDIKPANIYIREDNTPVLLDFGSARQALGEQTKTLTSIVSPGYAPFEQYYSKSDRQGPWTDIYSLAATMYRAISGIMPMDAIDRSEAILKAERDIFVSAGEIGHGRYSEQFMRAIDHALNFSEKQRPQSIAAWRAELGIKTGNSTPLPPLAATAHQSQAKPEVEPVQSGEIETRLDESHAPSAQNVVEQGAPVGHGPPVHESRPGKRNRRGWWLGGATLATLALGVAVWSQWGAEQGSLFRELADAVAALGSGDGSVEQLVAKGDRALAADRAFDPLSGSAIDFYRQAIRIAPRHEGALQGITLISAQMRAAAEEAIGIGEMERAGALLETLRSLPGQQPEIQSIEAEFGNAHAVAAASAVQNVRIQEFLNEAATDFAEGRILTPSGNNALVRYRAIQVLDPENAEAKRGIVAIVSRLSEEHEAAVAARDFALAGERLQQIGPLHPDRTRFEEMQHAFDKARAEDVAATERDAAVARLLEQAAADLKANRLATPFKRNALDRYKEALALDPQNEAAAAGLVKVAARYVELTRAAIRGRQLDGARKYLARARSLDAPISITQNLSSELKAAEDKVAEEGAARAHDREKQRLAEAARQREEQERLRVELASARDRAATEKRRRQEAEAKRLFELEQGKQRALEAQQQIHSEAVERSTLVVEFDGFSDQLEVYGLKESDVRADVEASLRGLGYNIVLHHHANRSQYTRLFVVRFRANLNSAAGIFSYAASLSLYGNVPIMANRAGRSGQRPIWEKGASGVAQQTDLRRVRDEYKRTMRAFGTEVGQAPGRL